MQFWLEIAGYGGLAPAAVAAALSWLTARFVRPDVSSRYAVPLGLAAGFVAAYALFPWTSWVPSSYWQYLPYVGIGAALVGAVGAASGVTSVERWMLWALVAAGGAWVLVPDWASLAEQRLQYVAGVAAAMVVVAIAVEALAGALTGTGLLGLLTLALVAGAFVIVQAGSLKLAHLAGAAAAAMLGSAVGRWMGGGSGAGSGNVALPVSVLIVGPMFAAWIDSFSDVPAAGYLLVPGALVAAAAVGVLIPRTFGETRRRMLALAAAAVCLSAAVWLAARSGLG